MYKVVFLAEAINEIENAGRWYSKRQLVLGKRFAETILSAIERLQSDRIIYGPAYRQLSRIMVKQFLYVIYFRKKC